MKTEKFAHTKMISNRLSPDIREGDIVLLKNITEIKEISEIQEGDVIYLSVNGDWLSGICNRSKLPLLMQNKPDFIFLKSENADRNEYQHLIITAEMIESGTVEILGLIVSKMFLTERRLLEDKVVTPKELENL